MAIWEKMQYFIWLVNLMRSVVFKFGGEALTGNCSVGQLTTIGFKQQMTNGMMLKKAYVDSGFLSGQINKSEIYIRSDGKIMDEELVSIA